MKVSPSKHMLLAIFFAILLLYPVIILGYQRAFSERILPGVFMEDGINLGKRTREEAALAIRQAIAPTLAKREFMIDAPEPIPDVTLPFSQFIDFRGEIASDAYNIGRERGSRLWYAPFLLPLFPYTFDRGAAVLIDEEGLEKALQKMRASVQPKDAEFLYSVNPSSGALKASDVLEEHDGVEIDPVETRRRAKRAIALGESRIEAPILQRTPAAIRKADLEPLLSLFNQWTSAPLILSRESETLSLSPSMIADLITTTSTAKGRVLAIDQARLIHFFDGHPFTATAAPENGWIKLNASSTIEELKVPTRGQIVDVFATKNNMESALQTPSARIAKLEVKTSYGIFEGKEAERLGVRELIGKGDSNFAGSPTNRRRNISLGAERLHATLVPPGQIFSTMKALGPITGEAGWLPELVIKGNQTIPEFGGGLCQIGTTAFRAALNAGMPILERRNHSYRVRYYEPAGTDATLYDPSPDFKFKNDTQHTLLITKSIQKDTVSFLFWGTKDGRMASTTHPTITNIVQPLPKKTIETTDLKPGEVKCTESAHAGATASFNYSVLYTDGRHVTNTFRSVYRPWQAVCLVGVTSLSVPTMPINGPDETGLNNPG